jgi:hypothetical protein
MGFRRLTKTKFGQDKGDSLCRCHQDRTLHRPSHTMDQPYG